MTAAVTAPILVTTASSSATTNDNTNTDVANAVADQYWNEISCVDNNKNNNGGGHRNRSNGSKHVLARNGKCAYRYAACTRDPSEA